MNAKLALKIIFMIGLAGLLFSGYLSYNELFATCKASCPIVQVSRGIPSLPACVYGFFMYLTIVIVSGLGLQKK